MKRFFKRVNRGIVLAVVLLVGLAIFIWQDESSFQKETPAIEQTVTSYMEAVAKANIFDTNLQKIGATMTQAQQTDKLQEITKMINQYWTDSNAENGTPKSFILENVKDMVTQNSKGKGYIQKFTVKRNGTPTVKKSGPSNATATISYNVVIEYAGSPMYLFGWHTDSVSHFSGMEKDNSSSSAASTTPKRYTMQTQMMVELEKVGGTWKIATINDSGSNGGQPVDIE